MGKEKGGGKVDKERKQIIEGGVRERAGEHEEDRGNKCHYPPIRN